jgi:hypothetical protein
MELNVSAEICSFAQEEEPPGLFVFGFLSDWQLQQMTETNKMYLTIDFVAISIQE